MISKAGIRVRSALMSALPRRTSPAILRYTSPSEFTVAAFRVAPVRTVSPFNSLAISQNFTTDDHTLLRLKKWK